MTRLSSALLNRLEVGAVINRTVEDTIWDSSISVSISISISRRSDLCFYLVMCVGVDLVADLRYSALVATSYYDAPLPSNAPLGYGHQGHNGNQQAYYAPTQQPQSTTYGPVYYTVNHAPDVNHNASYDQRRGYEALNDFFGDAKRRGFDPNSYAEVGTRLMTIQGVHLPMVGGGGGMMSYQAAHPPMMNVGGGQGGVYAPTAQHAYALPLPNLRTKNDLAAVDQILEQMTTTVYENPNSTAAAGIQLPGHYPYGGMPIRRTHSPPALQLPSSHHNGYSPSPLMANGSSQSNHSGTPALTPPSSASVISHSAGHSPSSLPSNHAASPPNHGMMMYPTLPGANSASLSGDYPSSATAPPSTLGPSFDSDPRRRYSGGRLQKAQPSPRGTANGTDIDDDSMDTTDDKYSTAKRSPSSDHNSNSNNGIKREHPQQARAEQIIDPALADMMASPATEPSESPDDKVNGLWVENIRVIEGLRRYVQERLQRGEYEGGMADADPGVKREGEKVGAQHDLGGLYPALRGMEVGAE